MADFKLSASLAGHDDDVRAVAFPSSKAVISASRDGTVRLWKLLNSPPPSYDGTITYHGGGFVNAVTYLPPADGFQDGLIISGGQETIIEVRQPQKGQEEDADALLLGHSSNVCALDVDPAGKFIVSGSWDSEARIWPVGKWDSEYSTVLKEHGNSVWAVLAYDSETIITGCADQYIRIYHVSGKLIKSFKGSDQPIRALCRLPEGHPSGANFASAGNDSIIRLWTIGGKRIANLQGHDSFIYSLASLPSGEIVSSGEDRTLRIWQGTSCIQTITHPAISVWSVAVCPETGDIASGTSDKTVRIFTRSPERFADAETTQIFEESVRQSTIPKQQVGDLNKQDMPGPEFLTQKSGTRDGQIQTIKESDGSVTAHMWSSAQGAWSKVGVVVDSAGSGSKTNYEGKEYDYVFDVDIEDGKPPLKLPYNLSQNPYEAATKFIENNKLPISYLDQVANFITSNTQGATIGQSQAQETPDAWGSDQRYRPDSQPSAPAPPPKVLPQEEYLSIVVASYQPMQKKIEELNKALIADGHKDVSLNPAELATLSRLRSNLESKGVTKDSQNVDGGLDLAIKLSTMWPYKNRLPGLDLLRLLAIAPQTATYTHPQAGNVVDLLVASVTETSPPAENNVMMAVRAFANLFESSEGRTLAISDFDKIQGLTSSAVGTSNRNLAVAATTVYINYAVLLKTEEEISSFEQALALLDTLSKILTTQKDSEVIYRALVATGTLITIGDEVKSAAKDVYSIGASVSTAAAKASDPRIRNVAAEIKGLLG
ncbi:phospholipase A-2-activating protein-like protein [Coleophoma cylindrospora]|uniref:Phospholipase A-2-activating protein-like protein n=1 Tax=Coleophoma cylindrospora TaxID=1849047 RepID=A0A3D8QKK7_9HELO|nr:phospholipase A-2-activating protein-like protein [Coleophoma cylindrospora]